MFKTYRFKMQMSYSNIILKKKRRIQTTTKSTFHEHFTPKKNSRVPNLVAECNAVKIDLKKWHKTNPWRHNWHFCKHCVSYCSTTDAAFFIHSEYLKMSQQWKGGVGIRHWMSVIQGIHRQRFSERSCWKLVFWHVTLCRWVNDYRRFGGS
jgi:hypothetical protein